MVLGQKNQPRRLSIRNGSDGESNNTPLSPKNLNSVYRNCLDLFQAKKITTQNSFTCKLLDCIGPLLESPDFDITNMPLVGRTLEVGTRIYVCRVDYTYQLVMNLAQRIGARGKAMEFLRNLAEEHRLTDEAAEDGDVELGDNELDENGDPLFEEQKKPKERKKRPHMNVASKEKITISFHDKVENVTDRQRQVKKILTNFKERKQPFAFNDFGYVGFEEEKVVAENDFQERLKTVHKLRKGAVDRDRATEIKFFPFIWKARTDFNRQHFDHWGRPKEGPGSLEEELRLENERVEAEKAAAATSQTAKGADEYGFDANVVNNTMYEEMQMEHAHDDMHDFEADEMNGSQQASFENLGQVKDLEQLSEFYKALRAAGSNMKKAIGWAGPNFLKNRGGLMSSRPTTANSERRRIRKEPTRIDFLNIDWKDEKYRYHPVGPEKIELDDRTLARWMQNKLTIPFTGIGDELTDEEFDEDAFNEAFEISKPGANKKYVDPLLRYFIDPHRNILQLFDEHNSEETNEGDDGEEIIHQAFVDDGPLDSGLDQRELDDGAYLSQSQNEGSHFEVQNLDLSAGGKIEWDAFLNYFPMNVGPESENAVGNGEYEGMKYAKTPKPINMRVLKVNIIQILKDKLELDDKYKPTNETEEKTIDYLTLLAEVYNRVDERTSKFLTTSLLFVALLHVVADMGLFMKKCDGEMENIRIIAKPRSWKHADNIPLPSSDDGDDQRCLPPPNKSPRVNNDEDEVVGPMDIHEFEEIQNEANNKE